MTKQNFIAIADVIRNANAIVAFDSEQTTVEHFTPYAIRELANYFASVNPAFNRDRWLDYVAGNCGPNGGKIETTATANR